MPNIFTNCIECTHLDIDVFLNNQYNQPIQFRSEYNKALEICTIINKKGLPNELCIKIVQSMYSLDSGQCDCCLKPLCLYHLKKANDNGHYYHFRNLNLCNICCCG